MSNTRIYIYIVLYCLFLKGFFCSINTIWTAERLVEYSKGNRVNDPEMYLTSSERILQWVERIEKEKNFTMYIFVISQIDDKYRENNQKINIVRFLNDLSFLTQLANKEKDIWSIFILFSIEDHLMRIRTGANAKLHLSDEDAKQYLVDIKQDLKDERYAQAIERLLEKLHKHDMGFAWPKIMIVVFITVCLLYQLFCFIIDKIKVRNPQSQLEKIRKITQRNMKLKTFLEERCIICLENLKPESSEHTNEFTAKLDCGHSFHSQCISAWMTKNNSCPICRNSIDNDTSESKPLSEHLLTVQRVIYPEISNWEFTHTITDFTWRVVENHSTDRDSGGCSYSSDWGNDSGGATADW